MLSKKESLVYTGKITVICFVFVVILYALYSLLGYIKPRQSLPEEVMKNSESQVLVVLDAGHGGRDGGAISENGILEKDLNLAVTRTLYDLLALCGIDVVMTRNSDSLVCDENDPALKGKLKMTDLKNRLSIAESHPNAIFVSIHMNNFPVEKYNGLQVYYSGNHPASYEFAQSVQDNVRVTLQPDNERKVKEAGSNIFLLDRISIPAVLIECGFLSNPEEAEKLSTSIYQSQLALVIADSILLNLMQAGNN